MSNNNNNYQYLKSIGFNNNSYENIKKYINKHTISIVLLGFILFGSIINSRKLDIYNNVATTTAATTTTTTTTTTTQQKQRPPTLSEITRNHIKNITCPEPLVPIYDRIVHKDDEENGNGNGGIIIERPKRTIKRKRSRKQKQQQKIPKSIHLAWIRGYQSKNNDSRCISQDMIEIVDKWKNQFPSYNFYFHDDYAVDYLLEHIMTDDTDDDDDSSSSSSSSSKSSSDFEEFPFNIKQIMESCVKFGSAMRIDIWRILILYKYGGFYSDFDYGPGPKLTEKTIAKKHSNDTAFFLSAALNRPSQWLMGIEPNHPIMYFTLIEIFKSLLDMDDISQPRLVFTTGPDALLRGYKKAISTGSKGNEPLNQVLKPGIHKTRIDIFDNNGGGGGRRRGHGRDHDTQEQKIVHKLPRLDLNYSDYVWTNKYDKVPYPRSNLGNKDLPKIIIKKKRIEYEMNTTHWTKFLKSNKKNVPKGKCIDHLYRNSRSRNDQQRA
jgi:hypothetical protein